MLLIRLLTISLAIGICRATKPPGYVEKPKPYDPNPPNYDYSYSVSDHSGGQQGHLEKRNGEHTEGHYFVNDPKESSSQEVRYSADDWGFHPLVKYSGKTPSGHFSARFALGEQAVKEFKQEQNSPMGTTPIAPLLAGTVLPAGTSTDGFIHHDIKNGIQTLHPMALQPSSSAVDILPQQPLVSPSHQNVIQLVPVLPTIPQPQFFETEPLTTVLSPVQPDYKYIQNVNTQPDGNVQYFSNINGDNSKSSINVQLGPRGPPSSNSLEDPEKSIGDVDNNNQPIVYQTDYEDTDEKLPIPEELISGSINAGITVYDSETIDIHNVGGFGSKLKSPSMSILKSKDPKKTQIKTSSYIVSTTTVQPVTSTVRNGKKYNQPFSKLVESTKNLVTNEDLLDINSAVEAYSPQGGKIEDPVYFTEFQNSVPTPESNVVTIKPSPTIFTLQGIVRVADNPGIKKPSGAGVVSIEHAGRFRNTHGDVFKSPIVVADFEHNNIIATSTPSTVYSSTPSIFESETSSLFDYVPIQGYTNQPSSTTILVTPRPVSQKFLAPLNAGLRLVTTNTVDKFLDCPNPPTSSDVKAVEDEVIEQENEENNALKTVVELFKSVPLENINFNDLSNNSTITQVKQLAYNLRSQQSNVNNLQEYPSALEDSKRIQQTSNQQLYQFGAQQVLIHPAEQQNQLAAEELHQQLEENHEESIKQESIQSQYVQRGVDKDQIVLHYPSNNHVLSAQPLVQQHIAYKSTQPVLQFQSNAAQSHNQVITNANAHSGGYSISVQHGNHAQSNSNNEHQNFNNVPHAPAQYNQPVYLQPQQYLLYGQPQYLQYSQPNYHIQGAESHRNEKQIPVPYVSNYLDTKQVPYYVVHDNKVNTNHHQVSQPLPVQVQHPYVVENNGPYGPYAPVQQVIESNVPVESKIPYTVSQQHVGNLKPIEKHIPYPITIEKIVEKKVPYPVEVKVPVKVEVPYPVEKIVEKPVHIAVPVQVPYPVEKIVEKPIEVTKYINTPYPVEKPVPYPVQVERIVEKKVPYPVEIKVPYKVEITKPVPYPVEKPYSIPFQIPNSYAVSYSSPIPQASQQIFSTAQNTFLPHGWALGYNLNQQFFNNIKTSNQPVKYSEPSKYPPIADSYYRKNLGPYGQSHTYKQPTTYLYSVPDQIGQHSHNVNNYYKYAPSSKPSNDYWNSNNAHFSVNNNHQSNFNSGDYFNVGGYRGETNQYTYGNDHNIGNTNNFDNHQVHPHFRYKKEREAKGLRVEYGFKPPLIPSLEIDLEGRPIKREKP